MTQKLRDFLSSHEWAVAAGLMLLGALARLLFLSQYPAGLNQDEASAGYEAFCLLTTGADRYGNPWPVLFPSWGSGQNVLYSYLTVPFVALFGLSEWSIRLTAAVFGTLTLPVFWDLARRLGGRGTGLCALGLLAVNPWHIMLSRWALESNLLPFFLLLGVWCLVRAMERPAFFLGAGLAFGLSLYAYGTAFFFLPVFLLCALAYLWRTRTLRTRWVLPGVALLVLLALPVALCQLRNLLGLPGGQLLWMSLPQLTESRQAATSVFGGGSALQNMGNFLALLWKGGDGWSFNALPGFGLFYPFGLGLAAVGLVEFCVRLWRRGLRRGEALMGLWLLCGFLCAFFIDGNVNRMNMALLPILWFSVLGTRFLMGLLGRWSPAVPAGVLVCFALFCLSYWRLNTQGTFPGFYNGLGEALRAAEAREPAVVRVTNDVNMPYIFALFYLQVPPEEFYSTVEFYDPQADFRWVRSFEGFRFGEERTEGEVLVTWRDQVGEYQVLEEYGDFALCR